MKRSALMPTLGNAVFRIEGPISTMPVGSSDMTWNYVQEFWHLVLAAVGAVACVAYVRRQSTYDSMHGWFRIIVRYSLAQHMLSYGLIKVFGRQMALDPLLLEWTYAESSPGGLLWTFSWWVVEQWQQRAARLARADDKPAFHGVWGVDHFELDGEPQPGDLRWRRLLLGHPGLDGPGRGTRCEVGRTCM